MDLVCDNDKNCARNSRNFGDQINHEFCEMPNFIGGNIPADLNGLAKDNDHL
ncbi:hypothetical protein RhiirA4_486055 [Rhizophagus irregularis]|uniref:Uncharacterized protein n=1 Tax=Rhizophagus irregularis TaxID=588596 RepID=A0A2I1HQZ5_9GLOM|nr:hypothetical protein RhiirA4_486055 [Rhizophagus irregularis]